MSNLKCPICGKDLVEIELGECWFLVCCNSKCRCKGVASDTVWKYIERTRKALDVALCSLQDIAESDGDFITGASTPLDEHEYADMMLKEIKRQMKIKTALEQKDVK